MRTGFSRERSTRSPCSTPRRRRLGLTEAHVEDAFGSTQIAGGLPLALAHWSLPVTLLLVAAPFLTAALTTQVHPHLLAELYGLGPGHDRAVAGLVLRNGLLAGWYLNALRRMAKQGAPARRLWGGSDRTLRGLVLPLRPSGR